MHYFNEYLDSIETLIAKLRGDSHPYRQAAQEIVARLARGGMIYTFGTGHGHLLALEVFYRAGGLVRVSPLLDESLMLHRSASQSTLAERKPGIAKRLLEEQSVGADDIVIVISSSGRNAAPVEMALEAKQRGAYVVALTSLTHSMSEPSRHDSGMRLFECADITLDNHGGAGDACIKTVSGSMACPTSTAVGAAALQALVAAIIETAESQGTALELFVSSNVTGGDEINAQYLKKYQDKIQCL